MKKILTLLLFISISVSCSDDEINYDAKNESDIEKYIADNELDAKKTNSGLYYVITKEGTGENPTTNSNVTVIYKGYFLNEHVFEQNTNGISFNLQQVIKGWTEGLTYFKEGGEGILLIPSKLGYGSQGTGKIPGGSVIVFDIKLLEVN